MKMHHNKLVALTACASVALCTIAVDKLLWQLGDTYWFALGLLAFLHIVISGVFFIANAGNRLFRLSIVLLLLVGQWWAVQMLAMQIIWRVQGFAP